MPTFRLHKDVQPPQFSCHFILSHTIQRMWFTSLDTKFVCFLTSAISPNPSWARPKVCHATQERGFLWTAISAACTAGNISCKDIRTYERRKIRAIRTSKTENRFKFSGTTPATTTAPVTKDRFILRSFFQPKIQLSHLRWSHRLTTQPTGRNRHARG